MLTCQNSIQWAWIENCITAEWRTRKKIYSRLSQVPQKTLQMWPNSFSVLQNTGLRQWDLSHKLLIILEVSRLTRMLLRELPKKVFSVLDHQILPLLLSSCYRIPTQTCMRLKTSNSRKLLNLISEAKSKRFCPRKKKPNSKQRLDSICEKNKSKKRKNKRERKLTLPQSAYKKAKLLCQVPEMLLMSMSISSRLTERLK